MDFRKILSLSAQPDQSTQPNRDTHVHDLGDLRKYRTETPNLVYDLHLTPFELALYCYLKRVAGAGVDGRCFRATERIAEETGMSEGMVSKAKKGLLRTNRPGLNSKALIRVEKDDTRPGRPRDMITIVDIWPENFLFFAKQSSPQSSPGELQSSPQSSPGEAKNKTLIPKKEQSEESTHKALNVGGGQAEQPDAALSSEASTLNASQSDFEFFSSQDELPTDAAPAVSNEAPPKPSAPESLLSAAPPAAHRKPTTTGQPAVAGKMSSLTGTAAAMKKTEIDRVVRMTEDEGSRRRFEQLYELAEGAGLLLCWDQARKSTHKAIQNGAMEGPPGAYFNAVVGRLLNEERPALVPVGTRAERRSVAALARSSLAAADAAAAVG